MEEQRLRLASVFEWAMAALGVAALAWLLDAPVQRLIGPRLHAAMTDVNQVEDAPPGIPPGATVVPVMLLLDGREIRQGELHVELDRTLPARFATGPPKVSDAKFGPRHTREYVVDGVHFFVVCERMEPNGQLKVAGIYLP